MDLAHRERPAAGEVPGGVVLLDAGGAEEAGVLVEQQILGATS